MSTPIERAEDELTRIVNHSGLDPENTLNIETEIQGKHLFSFVTGVNAQRTQLAIGDFLDGRDDVEVKIVPRRHGDDYLIVTQPIRE